MPKKHDVEKAVDLPPKGSRNPDPATDQPGSHPIETGIGAAVGGAASGLAVGTVAGPVGAAVGAAVGAVAGGLAGKGIGEVIDPTTEDNWLRDNFTSRPYVKKGETYEKYQEAYRYGGAAEARHHGHAFDEVEGDLKRDWGTAKGHGGMTWGHARDAVRDAYDRTVRLREEHLKVNKATVEAGEVRVRKEVHTETKHIDVPVEREEVVIERTPASGRASEGDIREEEIVVPVRGERVTMTKQPVITEEVSVGKRKVRDTKHVSETVRKEELAVHEKGDVKVKDRSRSRN
jgi:uncharacterized protein (TIGR02271 family)